MATSFCRNNDENVNNTVCDNTKATTKDVTLPGRKEEHVYDTVAYDDTDKKQARQPKNNLCPNDYQNSTRSTDCGTIKSDQLPVAEYYILPETKKTTNREKSKLPSKPNYANVPPKNLPLEDEEYVLIVTDIKHTTCTDDQYASLDKSERAENNQYTSLVPQCAGYQAPVTQPPPPLPSKYAAPKGLPTN